MSFGPKTEHEGCIQDQMIPMQLTYGAISDIIVALTERCQRDLTLFAQSQTSVIQQDEPEPEQLRLIAELGEAIKEQLQTLKMYKGILKEVWFNMPEDRQEVEKEFHAKSPYWAQEEEAVEEERPTPSPRLTRLD